MSAKTSVEKIEWIVQLKRQGLTDAEVHSITGIARSTINRNYNKYRDDTYSEIVQHGARELVTLIDRLKANWLLAMQQTQTAIESDDPNAPRYMDLERKALEAWFKVLSHVSAPEEAGKITEKQAQAFVTVIQNAAAKLPVSERAAFVADAAAGLRSLGEKA